MAGVQPDWSAAHVPGQVLVLGGAGRLSAQGTTALSGVRTQAVVPGVTLAFTPAGESDRAFAARLDAARGGTLVLEDPAGWDPAAQARIAGLIEAGFHED